MTMYKYYCDIIDEDEMSMFFAEELTTIIEHGQAVNTIYDGHAYDRKTLDENYGPYALVYSDDKFLAYSFDGMDAGVRVFIKTN